MLSGSAQSIAVRQLAERLRVIETSSRHSSARVQTGWQEIDAALADGGLRCGAIHEFCGVGGDRLRGDAWVPPLLILLHLARRALGERAGGPGWSVWIGRRVWVHGHAAIAGLGRIDRALWVDAPERGARSWAVEAALRCPGVVVVADGSGFDAAASRRLQLAAASSGTLALMARPAHELKQISFASTRWAVETQATGTLANRWGLRLSRQAGLDRVDMQRWGIERACDGGLVCSSPDLGDRPGAAAGAC